MQIGLNPGDKRVNPTGGKSASGQDLVRSWLYTFHLWGEVFVYQMFIFSNFLWLLKGKHSAEGKGVFQFVTLKAS